MPVARVRQREAGRDERVDGAGDRAAHAQSEELLHGYSESVGRRITGRGARPVDTASTGRPASRQNSFRLW